MHTPVAIGKGLFTFALPVTHCQVCDRPMMHKDRSGLFSPYKEFSQEAQMARTKIVMAKMRVPGSDYFSGKSYACEGCVAEGKVTFTCAICKQKRSSDQLHEENYEEPECKLCYETMPAKAWAEWHKDQDERNRWYND